uniref:Uncharacterized protein n=1 Tax=Rhizophora mucronata TaxID=61149 RepID=A0A2P2PYM4_RHIMU
MHAMHRTLHWELHSLFQAQH